MSNKWGELVRAAERTLATAEVPSARVDAELLAAHVSGTPRSRLVMAPEPIPEQIKQYRQLINRRADREPLQHLTGSAAFWRGELSVGPGVFVPRPETELLVEWALGVLANVRSPVVIDACSGSGAIAWALAHERPDATIWAIEMVPDACEWLELNLAGTVAQAVLSDATEFSTLPELDGSVDLVVSNPPYVPETTDVAPEVLADPGRAVFAAREGMEVINDLTFRAQRWLKPAGWFGCEHDDSHAATVPGLLQAVGFVDVVDHLDYAQRPRFTTGRLPDHPDSE